MTLARSRYCLLPHMTRAHTHAECLPRFTKLYLWGSQYFMTISVAAIDDIIASQPSQTSAALQRGNHFFKLVSMLMDGYLKLREALKSCSGRRTVGLFQLRGFSEQCVRFTTNKPAPRTSTAASIVYYGYNATVIVLWTVSSNGKGVFLFLRCFVWQEIPI